MGIIMVPSISTEQFIYVILLNHSQDSHVGIILVRYHANLTRTSVKYVSSCTVQNCVN
jgi:hypothetical protein